MRKASGNRGFSFNAPHSCRFLGFKLCGAMMWALEERLGEKAIGSCIDCLCDESGRNHGKHQTAEKNARHVRAQAHDQQRILDDAVGEAHEHACQEDLARLDAG